MPEIMTLPARTYPELESAKGQPDPSSSDDKVMSARALVMTALHRRSETLANLNARSRRPTRW